MVSNPFTRSNVLRIYHENGNGRPNAGDAANDRLVDGEGLVQIRKIGGTVRFDWDEVCEHLRARNQPPITIPETIPDRHTGTGIAEMLSQRAAEIRRSTR